MRISVNFQDESYMSKNLDSLYHDIIRILCLESDGKWLEGIPTNLYYLRDLTKTVNIQQMKSNTMFFV